MGNMHDSNKRQQFNSGAVRDTADGKSRIDLISPYAQWRAGEWLREGAEKYSERNWEQGMPISRCIASMERHIQEFKMGKTNEDHLAAIIVNGQFIIHYERMIELGLLPKELDDLPKYEKVKTQPTNKLPSRKPCSDCAYQDVPCTESPCKDNCLGARYHPNWEPKPFVVLSPWSVKFHDGFNEKDCGYYVYNEDKDLCLHKDLELHEGTGYESYYGYGRSPGYWLTEKEAEDALKQYLEN